MTGDAAMNDETLRKELRLFGLSEKEIQTYLTVLRCGEAKVSTISEESDVSHRYVYRIAEQLDERGLVVVNDHAAPTTVRARPPAEALSALAERLNAIAPALEEQYVTTAPKTSQFEIVKSRPTALKRLREILDGAQTEVFLSVPERVYPALESELIAAVDRDALVLLLLGGESELDAKRLDGTASVIRQWEENVPFMLTADNQSAIVGDAELLTGKHADETAVALSQGHIAGSILGSFIGSFWPVATETYVTDPCPLPATFESFRHAALQSTLHRRAGTELHATVSTEAGTELTGRIVEVRQGLTEPATNDFPVESGLVLATDAGEVSVGGEGAFIEDHRAESVALRSP